MKIGIMQPYLFPYLGYFQLIHAVDVFVIYDDVQYRKKGWINRNRILLNHDALLFTFGVKRESRTKHINQRSYSKDIFHSTKERFLKTLFHSYHDAPYFNEVHEVIIDILHYEDRNISKFNTNCLRKLCDYMHIDTPFVLSSSLERTKGLNAEDAVVEINQILGGHCYINAIGGMKLYSPGKFEENGIELKFLKMDEITYYQFDGQFIPDLSIIDILMFNSKGEIDQLLNNYELLQNYSVYTE